MSDISKTEVHKTDISKTGAEELLEDFFGLNVRSFRTLKTAVFNPRPYFEAARTAEWSANRFTPSPRLWLALITITVATRFIWGGDSSEMMVGLTDVMQSSFENGLGGRPAPDLDWPSIIQRFFDITLLIQPFIFMAMMLLFATFIRFWGEALPYVVRVRYLFAIIVPASLINVLLTFVMVVLPAGTIAIVSFASLGIMAIMYAVIAFAGPFATEPMDSRLPKSIVLSIILFVGVMLANFISQGIAIAAVLIPELAAIRDAGG